MLTPWLRRFAGGIACVVALALSGCGSGTITSALKPDRFVVFGDGMSDIGTYGARLTVNDGISGVWIEQMAARYGKTLTLAASGGTAYARAHARVAATPDAAGRSDTLTLTGQIDSFLSRDKIGTNDVFVINAGISDLLVQLSAMTAGSQTEAQMMANLATAGRAMGAQTRRLVDAGARYVVVVGSYNLGRSPWAKSILKQEALLERASLHFNNNFLESVVDLGAHVLYIDAALHFNLVTGIPANYAIKDATSIACTSVDPGPGIGIGAGQVNSSRCTPSTIASGIDYAMTAFADAIYFTPAAHRSFSDYAYFRLTARW
jgi:phospholipase/lecithinase/hemolysin